MCGRFAVTTPAEAMRQLFGSQNPLINLAARTNIAPTDAVAVVRRQPDSMANSAAGAGARALDLLRWGLVPHWAKAIPNPPLINARAETIADKPSFRQALLKRRCVIPADAFYEWRAGSQPKQPYAIRSSAGGMLCFAGIWENWRQPNGDWLRSCAIITTAANTAMAALHDRMPAILAPEDIRLWLGDQPADPARVQALLRPCPDDWLEIYPVDPAVNRVGVDQPWFLDRVAG